MESKIKKYVEHLKLESNVETINNFRTSFARNFADVYKAWAVCNEQGVLEAMARSILSAEVLYLLDWHIRGDRVPSLVGVIDDTCTRLDIDIDKVGQALDALLECDCRKFD